MLTYFKTDPSTLYRAMSFTVISTIIIFSEACHVLTHEIAIHISHITFLSVSELSHTCLA